MKKMLSLLLTLMMLFTSAFSAVSLAETAEALLESQRLEMTAAMEWLLRDKSPDEYEEMFSWDRDTMLENLKDYDQPLETVTKEEIADRLTPVLNMFSLVFDAAEEENGGETLLDMLGSLLNDSEEADARAEDEEEYEIDYASFFNGTLWECGELKLESVWQDGYYKIAIREGDTELAYLCELDTETGIAAGIGAGDPETTESQPDHGVAAFYINDLFNLVWKKADGEEIVFTEYVHPLAGALGYSDGIDVMLIWEGDLSFNVFVQRENAYWVYECELNEETDTLTGSGYQGYVESNEKIEGLQGAFVFLNDRAQLVWTDAQIPVAQNGKTLDMYDSTFTSSFFTSDDFGIFLFTLDGYYNIQVYELSDYTESKEYGYLCEYDWTTRTMTALDPAAIDFDDLTLKLDRDIYTSTATFVLEDEYRLVWHDDAGAAGDGVVFRREPY